MLLSNGLINRSSVPLHAAFEDGFKSEREESTFCLQFVQAEFLTGMSNKLIAAQTTTVQETRSFTIWVASSAEQGTPPRRHNSRTVLGGLL